ncbi:MAG TPA: hypothetical protein VK623_04300 [Flavobacterium sp.]|nr:hypothetical protein [Flavobacterium sp.]
MKKMIFIVCFMMLVRPVVPVLQYILNYDYISQELCVNKETPILGCNGKCYLIKQLAKASESEKPTSSDKKHVLAETTDLFFETIENYDLFQFEDKSKSLNPGYLDLYKSSDLHSVFRPPVFIS